MKKEIGLAFLTSCYKESKSVHQLNDVIDWLKDQNNKVKVNISCIRFDELQSWYYDDQKGNIRHDSGKFFSIDGIDVTTNLGLVKNWQQPIINQPEIGYLGIIVKPVDGVLHFLMQAKIEPGNVNYVQLSPTIQATKSNYTRVHEGKKPAFLEYFQQAKSHQILLDQLQSEQGARFLRKRNRNIIIQVNEELTIPDNFIWLTLYQIKQLMTLDNLVNMDTRTVISGIPYGEYSDFVHLVNSHSTLINQTDLNDFARSYFDTNHQMNDFDDVISFITKRKSHYELEVSPVSLKKLNHWVFSDYTIHHQENKYFRVIAVRVEIDNREVTSWTQPMIEPAQEGLCAFVCKKINGVLHFAVQAKLECGNFDIIELAPTVQCLTGNFRAKTSLGLPFLEYVLNASKDQIVFDNLQSEEGGRFFKEQNRNLLVIAGDELSNELPEDFIWMTLNQLHTFIKFNNYINIQARSLLSAISFFN
jgi:oxidase EvaA